MNNRQIKELKHLINIGDIDVLKEHYQVYQQNKYDYQYQNDATLFQQLFTHACQKRKFEIAKWLYSLYQQLDFATQIAIRHTFNYCHATMDRKKHPHFKRWLNQIVQTHRQRLTPQPA